jgi:TonB family protein
MILKFHPFAETEFGRDFWTMFWVSLTVHIGLIVIIAFSRRILPPPVYYAPPSYTVDLVTIEQPKPVKKPTPVPSKAKAAPKPKPVPKPKPKVEEKIPIPETTTKKEEKKAPPEKKKIEEKVEPKKAEPKAPPKREFSEKEISSAIAGLKKKVTAKRSAEQKAIAARGRVTSRLMEIKYKVYYNTIWEIIREAWTIPEGVQVKPDLETIIGIRINKGGKILDIDVEKSSGNDPFDNSAIRAIERSSPLPAFPGDEKELEVGIRFTPEEYQ